jgi:hypothetical protein
VERGELDGGRASRHLRYLGEGARYMIVEHK